MLEEYLARIMKMEARRNGGIFKGDYGYCLEKIILRNVPSFMANFVIKLWGLFEYQIFLIPTNKMQLRELFNIHNGPLDRYHLFI